MKYLSTEFFIVLYSGLLLLVSSENAIGFSIISLVLSLVAITLIAVVQTAFNASNLQGS